MPKVSDAYREARRDEIAHAAMRCMARNGFGGTSMADIIAESGLSAGAIYSHFAGKAEIARYVARFVVGERGEELLAYAAAQPAPLNPAEIVAHLMEAIDRAGVPKPLLLQIWAEATVDDELHQLTTDAAGQLSRAYATAVRPWLVASGATATPKALRDAASTMLTLSQGYIVRSALFGGTDPGQYLASAGRLLG